MQPTQPPRLGWRPMTRIACAGGIDRLGLKIVTAQNILGA
jgi:hypothetical protein